MIGVHKFSLKNFFFLLLTLASFSLVTWHSKAADITKFEIYSTLTSDTIKPIKKIGIKDSIPSKTLLQNTIPVSSSQDTIPIKRDSVLKDTVLPRTDTFSLKISKDTLDGPVHYEAEDSAVILVADKKMILYGKTRTTYQDIILNAPKVEFDEQTNILTAVSEKDSAGYILTRARFEQGENKFESDTIQFNFKTQKGLTKKTFTQQDEFFVQGGAIKKVNTNTIFISEGRFTTCNLDEPHFDFRSRRMKVVNNKVAVTGYVQLAFEDVPIPKPIGLPFGIFPLDRGRRSGLLPVRATTTEQFGVGLEGIGYHKVLNDYYDVTIRGNLYSYGGWLVSLIPNYRKRYR
ncbi:MAG TPA: putative LPS assembly protein LptD, partial [Chitinophagaceae bacterium]|nr:putative LPS assembly protein LptD [Chitinophagaceae bacterium]